MSNKPQNTYKFKGIKVNDWGEGKFSIEKQYFKKEGDGGQWVDTKTYFKNELEELLKLIEQALMKDPETQSLVDKHQPEVSEEVPFDDDDIPF